MSVYHEAYREGWDDAKRGEDERVTAAVRDQHAKDVAALAATAPEPTNGSAGTGQTVAQEHRPGCPYDDFDLCECSPDTGTRQPDKTHYRGRVVRTIPIGIELSTRNGAPWVTWVEEPS